MGVHGYVIKVSVKKKLVLKKASFSFPGRLLLENSVSVPRGCEIDEELVRPCPFGSPSPVRGQIEGLSRELSGNSFH